MTPLLAKRIIVAVCFVVAGGAAAQAQGINEVQAANQKVAQLHQNGRYAEAATMAVQALALAERALGKEHRDTLVSLNNLALAHIAQGRYDDAEPLLQRALETRLRVFGPSDRDTFSSYNSLGALHRMRGRYADAEPLFKHALEGRERTLGPETPETIESVNNLSELYSMQGRYKEAEPLMKRAIDVLERRAGRQHPNTLTSVNNLAVLYHTLGRYDEAAALYKRVLDGYGHQIGKDHPDMVRAMVNLAELYRAQGRDGEAEPLYQRGVAMSERVLGRDHHYTLNSLHNLAMLYNHQERYHEAEPLYRRGLEAAKRVLGQDHPLALAFANNLASLYSATNRHAEAEALYKRSTEGFAAQLGAEHPSAIAAMADLGVHYASQGRYSEAEPLLKKSLSMSERAFGDEHPDTVKALNNLALMYSSQGRAKEAEALYTRALKINERLRGADNPVTGVMLHNLAFTYFTQRDWAHAAEFWRRSSALLIGRTESGARQAAQRLLGKKKTEAERDSNQFVGLIKAVSRMTPKGAAADVQASREMFRMAQWALNSDTAASLAQMAARSAKGDGELAVLVRERQDLLADWQKRDAWRNAALGQEAAKRNAEDEAENTKELAAIDARVAEIDKRLAAEFPDYAALASPAPLTVEEAQAQLNADEALVLFVDAPEWGPTPDEIFVWVVTKTEMRWGRSELGGASLAREVMALRCGLDAAAWDDAGARRCADALGLPPGAASASSNLLPFDHARAHALYKALFGQMEDLIKGKRLLLTLSGPLTQLPFQVLVTAKPANGDHKSAAWLVRDHALSVLPAVSSLKALRRTARPSAATKAMIGFGNPLLDGPDAGYAALAKRAREKASCGDSVAPSRVAALAGQRGGIRPYATRGGLADASHIRSQAPLPETADELCAVARDLGADFADIRLGTRATETEVKSLSASGRLGHYRIVHFATHGALAGQIVGGAEPGLLLTPPKTASQEDDGYLSASEIAGLKLDADWVILSACNTAAGDAAGAQALSGLARAFIYAQARALLVSHWEVDSNATVKLITEAASAMSQDGGVGRAEALRRAMLKLIDKEASHEAHPAYWAPFVVVGEGAR